MAELSELSDMVIKRFKDVPNVTSDDTNDWVERAMIEHGYEADADVPQDDLLLILMYAEWDGTLQIALKSAYYFQFKDAEETVDKRNVSEQYRRVASELWKRYERKKAEYPSRGGATFSVMTRADRPPSAN